MISIPAEDLDRWRIPRPDKPGTTQQLLIEGLAPGSEQHFFIQAYDQAGNSGPVAHTELTLPVAKPAAPADEWKFDDLRERRKNHSGNTGSIALLGMFGSLQSQSDNRESHVRWV